MLFRTLCCLLLARQLEDLRRVVAIVPNLCKRLENPFKIHAAVPRIAPIIVGKMDVDIAAAVCPNRLQQIPLFDIHMEDVHHHAEIGAIHTLDDPSGIGKRIDKIRLHDRDRLQRDCHILFRRII